MIGVRVHASDGDDGFSVRGDVHRGDAGGVRSRDPPHGVARRHVPEDDGAVGALVGGGDDGSIRRRDEGANPPAMAAKVRLRPRVAIVYDRGVLGDDAETNARAVGLKSRGGRERRVKRTEGEENGG
jgi:hypothetical protein